MMATLLSTPETILFLRKNCHPNNIASTTVWVPCPTSARYFAQDREVATKIARFSPCFPTAHRDIAETKSHNIDLLASTPRLLHLPPPP